MLIAPSWYLVLSKLSTVSVERRGDVWLADIRDPRHAEKVGGCAVVRRVGAVVERQDRGAGFQRVAPGGRRAGTRGVRGNAPVGGGGRQPGARSSHWLGAHSPPVLEPVLSTAPSPLASRNQLMPGYRAVVAAPGPPQHLFGTHVIVICSANFAPVVIAARANCTRRGTCRNAVLIIGGTSGSTGGFKHCACPYICVLQRRRGSRRLLVVHVQDATTLKPSASDVPCLYPALHCGMHVAPVAKPGTGQSRPRRAPSWRARPSWCRRRPASPCVDLVGSAGHPDHVRGALKVDRTVTVADEGKVPRAGPEVVCVGVAVVWDGVPLDDPRHVRVPNITRSQSST